MSSALSGDFGWDIRTAAVAMVTVRTAKLCRYQFRTGEKSSADGWWAGGVVYVFFLANSRASGMALPAKSTPAEFNQ
jgi:hypothetical protein